MRVIGKQLNMKTIEDKNVYKRRSFIIRVFGGIAGGWVAGNLFPGIERSTALIKSNKAIQVKINPLAIPRSNKEEKSHGA